MSARSSALRSYTDCDSKLSTSAAVLSPTAFTAVGFAHARVAGLPPRLPSEASLRRPQTEGTLSGVRGLRRRAASQSQIAVPSRVTRLDALTDAFVDEFKRGHKRQPACLKIQAAWRMHVERVYFLAKIRLRRECMRPPLRAWQRLAVAASHSRRARKRAALSAWRGEARLTLRLLRYLAHGLETVDGARRGASGAARAWHSFCERHARRNHARDDAARRRHQIGRLQPLARPGDGGQSDQGRAAPAGGVVGEGDIGPGPLPRIMPLPRQFDAG